jgi:hypothetical protein
MEEEWGPVSLDSIEEMFDAPDSDRIADRVRYILHVLPEAKENRRLLFLTYWVLFDKIDIPKEVFQDLLIRSTTPETIIRCRRQALQMDIDAERMKEQMISAMSQLASERKESDTDHDRCTPDRIPSDPQVPETSG